MIQVGENRTFTLTNVPAGTYTYVWNWWDGTTSVTTVPTVVKRINYGGDPRDSFLLRFSVRVVRDDGASVLIPSNIQVNNAPTLSESIALTKNDDFLPFSTDIRVRAYDLERQPLSFAFYSAGDFIGTGAISILGQVNGTWQGTYIGTYTGTQSILTLNVETSQTVTVVVVDGTGGTSTVDVGVRGGTPPLPIATAQAEVTTLTGDATSLPDFRLGETSSIPFAVYAADIAYPWSELHFFWQFFGTNGWNVEELGFGDKQQLADGSWKCTFIKSLAGETQGNKKALIRVTNETTLKAVEVEAPVTVLANQGVTEASFKVYRQTTTSFVQLDLTESDEHTPDYVAPGTVLKYECVANDPEYDLLRYRWTFIQPTGAEPQILVLWGRSVMLPTTGYPEGSVTQATVVITDRLGVASVFEAPIVVVATPP